MSTVNVDYPTQFFPLTFLSGNSFVPDMDANEMEILASTVSFSQREALLEFLGHHVKLNPSIQVLIQVRITGPAWLGRRFAYQHVDQRFPDICSAYPPSFPRAKKAK